MKPLRAAFIAAAVIFASLGAASTAWADHTNVNSHWGHGYQPLVSAPCGSFGGTFCNYTSAAERTWYQNGYADGVRGGNPYEGCGQWSGWILDCITTKTAVQNACSNSQAAGCTILTFTNDPAWHIDSVFLMICSACGHSTNGAYNTSELQAVVEHEYGHAFGLGHTSVTNSIMHNPVPWPNYGPVQHDYDALAWMYAAMKGDEDLCCGTQYVRSTNHAYYLVMQTDGNLVEYGPSGWVWQSGTPNSGGTRAIMQAGDGNVVIYRANGTPVCSTNTGGHPGAYMVVQTDGNLVVYTSSGQPIWARSWGSRCF